jgi:hypothetical protein
MCRMSHQPRAFNRPSPLASDSGGDDEAFPPTRFFSDALAQHPTPQKLKRRKRNLTVLAVSGFGLVCVAMAGLTAFLTA